MSAGHPGMKINPQSFFNFCANHAPLLRALAERGGEILHLPDYDPVGLSEFGRVHARLGHRAGLYLPPNHIPHRLQFLYSTSEPPWRFFELLFWVLFRSFGSTVCHEISTLDFSPISKGDMLAFVPSVMFLEPCFLMIHTTEEHTAFV